ncbi:MAG: superoxide dismutase [Desulfobacterales bacterium]
MVSLPRMKPESKIRFGLLATCVVAALFLVHCGVGGDATVFIQEPLPYPQDALAPFISADTMRFHHEAHYGGYVKRANQLARGMRTAGNKPEDLIRAAAGDPGRQALFNNAAQAWNHAFFFKCLKPEGGGIPHGLLAERIDASFGSFAKFKEAFLAAAGDHFGSGWVWLVLEGEKLAVVATADADTPLANGQTPLFTVDLWEHAYYLDYQNRRTDYVRSVLDYLVNWDFVAGQLERAAQPGSGA